MSARHIVKGINPSTTAHSQQSPSLSHQTVHYKVFKSIKCKGEWRCSCNMERSVCSSFVRAYPNIQYQGLLTRFEPEDECKPHEYRLFPSFASFYDFINNQPLNERSYHEVILGDVPQKVKIDVDIEGGVSSEHIQFISCIANLAKNTFFNMYYSQLCMYALEHSKNIEDDNFIDTCISYSGRNEINDTYSAGEARCNDAEQKDAETIGESINIFSKAGFHITIKDFMVPNHFNAQEFTRRLLKAIPAEYKKDKYYFHSIDTQVNKSIQNLRLIGCNKPRQYNRIKKLDNPFKDKAIDACITAGGKVLLNDVFKQDRDAGTDDDSTAVHASMTGRVSPFADVLFDLSKKELLLKNACDEQLDDDERQSHMFRNITLFKKGIYINYDRVMPSYCAICQRVHDKDNTLLFCIKYDEYESFLTKKSDSMNKSDSINKKSNNKLGLLKLCRHNFYISKKIK